MIQNNPSKVTARKNVSPTRMVVCQEQKKIITVSYILAAA